MPEITSMADSCAKKAGQSILEKYQKYGFNFALKSFILNPKLLGRKGD